MESAYLAFANGSTSAAGAADGMLRAWLAEWAAAGYSPGQVQAMLRQATHDPFGGPDESSQQEDSGAVRGR